MRRTVTAAVALTVLCAATSAFAASARFIDGTGGDMGTATLTDIGHGVLLRAELQGLPEGWHGFHFHQTGKCEGPDFKSAGGHFNPGGAKHGFKHEGGPHPGDLPNIYAGADGMVKVEIFSDRVSLNGGEDALLDNDGAAIVVHARPDDYQSSPSGASGDRIACAVIEP